jgi:hypothetical protein
MNAVRHNLPQSDPRWTEQMFLKCEHGQVGYEGCYSCTHPTKRDFQWSPANRPAARRPIRPAARPAPKPVCPTCFMTVCDC